MEGKLSSIISALAIQGIMQPEEKLAPVGKRGGSLVIGMPREDMDEEARIAITPLSAALLVAKGHQVVMETGAGEGANFSDANYAEAGVTISYSREAVLNSDVVIKVSPPGVDDIALMRGGQTLVSSVQPATLPVEVMLALMKKKISAFAFEEIRDEDGVLSVVRAMGEIVGATSILIAADYLSAAHGGKGLMLGGFTGIPPTEIVILGAGTVAEYAARTALSLGAEVKIFDSSIHKLRRLQSNLGFNRVFTSVMQPLLVNKAVKTCDVVIGAMRAEKGYSPCVITEETVSAMKAHSVIIDVSIDQGGCFETSQPTTHKHPTFNLYDVTHYCVPNIASRVPRTASYALTNIFTPFLCQLAEHGGAINLVWNKPWLRNALYTYKGFVTHKDFADRFQLPHKDLELLLVSNKYKEF